MERRREGEVGGRKQKRPRGEEEAAGSRKLRRDEREKKCERG